MNKSYIASSTPQIIDINKDMVNFECHFKLIGTEGKPFKAKITTQSELDTIQVNNMEFKDVQDSLEGDITSDKNVFQNYFIILMADTPTKVMVQLDIKALPTTMNPPPTLENKSGKKVTAKKQPKSSESGEDGGDNKWVSYVLLGIGIIILGFYMYKQHMPKNNSLLNKLKDINFN